MNKKLTALVALTLGLLLLTACSPEVGSKKWCQNMKTKDKGDWTAKEASDFLKHCIIPSNEQKDS